MRRADRRLLLEQRRITPQTLKIVELATPIVEHVGHRTAIIQHDPPSRGLSLDMPRFGANHRHPLNYRV